MVQSHQEIDKRMHSLFGIPTSETIKERLVSAYARAAKLGEPVIYPSQEYMAVGFRKIQEALGKDTENQELLAMRVRLTVRIALHDNFEDDVPRRT